jgi:hypothetical protein
LRNFFIKIPQNPIFGGKKMKSKALWVTRTAVMMALLITLQMVTKSLGQIVTGSFVNAVLAVTVLVCGLGSGVTVALLSPAFAYLLGIAPQILTVPAIMIGNTVFVVLLHLICGKTLWKSVAGLLVAAVCKFAVLYVLVTHVICGVLAQPLLAQGVLKEPMLKMLPATFSFPQLLTALIGGAVALAIAPVLKKALRK